MTSGATVRGNLKQGKLHRQRDAQDMMRWATGRGGVIEKIGRGEMAQRDTYARDVHGRSCTLTQPCAVICLDTAVSTWRLAAFRQRWGINLTSYTNVGFFGAAGAVADSDWALDGRGGDPRGAGPAGARHFGQRRDGHHGGHPAPARGNGRLVPGCVLLACRLGVSGASRYLEGQRKGGLGRNLMCLCPTAQCETCLWAARSVFVCSIHASRDSFPSPHFRHLTSPAHAPYYQSRIRTSTTYPSLRENEIPMSGRILLCSAPCWAIRVRRMGPRDRRRLGSTAWMSPPALSLGRGLHVTTRPPCGASRYAQPHPITLA